MLFDSVPFFEQPAVVGFDSPTFPAAGGGWKNSWPAAERERCSYRTKETVFAVFAADSVISSAVAADSTKTDPNISFRDLQQIGLPIIRSKEMDLLSQPSPIAGVAGPVAETASDGAAAASPPGCHLSHGAAVAGVSVDVETSDSQGASR